MRPSSKLRLPWVSLKWHEAIEDNLVRHIQACQQARIAEIKTVKSLCRDLDEAQEALRETQAQRDNLISGLKVQHSRADLAEQARHDAEIKRNIAQRGFDEMRKWKAALEEERDDLASRLAETDERARRAAQERNDLAARLAEVSAEREALLDSMLENVDALRDRLLDLRADDPAQMGAEAV